MYPGYSILFHWLWFVSLPRLVRFPSPGTGGRRRLCTVLWTAWVEGIIQERMLSTRFKAGNNRTRPVCWVAYYGVEPGTAARSYSYCNHLTKASPECKDYTDKSLCQCTGRSTRKHQNFQDEKSRIVVSFSCVMFSRAWSAWSCAIPRFQYFSFDIDHRYPSTTIVQIWKRKSISILYKYV